MIKKTLFLIPGILLLSIGGGCGRTPLNLHPIIQSQPPPKYDVPFVDKHIREQAAKLNVSEIKEFRFTGNQFERGGDEPIIITDKKEIGRYVTAMRHSYGRSLGLANGVNMLEIVFLPRKGKEVESQIYNFNLLNDLDCFGPEFRKEALALQVRIAQEDKRAQATHKSSP